ncbi:MAG: hypothetical protein ACOC89_04505 [Candidatus Saliniplasma sp.]
MTGLDLLVIIIILGIVSLIYFYFRSRVRKKALTETYGHEPSHMELYFEEYFEDMLENWDLMSKKEVKNWADDMDNRLNTVADDISTLKKRKKRINSQFDDVESRIQGLENKWDEEMRK